MSNPEKPTLSPQERFEQMKEWYLAAQEEGRLSGFYSPDFSETPLTHEVLNKWARKMNEKWVGDPRVHQWRPK